MVTMAEEDIMLQLEYTRDWQSVTIRERSREGTFDLFRLIIIAVEGYY